MSVDAREENGTVVYFARRVRVSPTSARMFSFRADAFGETPTQRFADDAAHTWLDT